MTTTLLDTAVPADLDRHAALKFITCGSVDDGKSTLIGRLLIDSRSVLQDQLDNVSKSGAADLALFTDGLSAEREQGITIDVAYRYFATPARKFIIGDTPGHEQYTRNMVTAASSADAAVVLVDATKLKWKDVAEVTLLPQTRRHALLLKLLRVPSIVFAVNKLDALEDPDHPQQATAAFTCIREALEGFAAAAGIEVAATIPISALQGHNVVTATPGWCGYQGASLLQLLETLPVTPAETALPLAFPVQWVEKFSSSSDTSQGRRVFWGRVATGAAQVGQNITVFPSGKTATIAQVFNHVRQPQGVAASHSAGIVLDRELDVSRGDWLLADDATLAQSQTVSGTVAWMDDAPLVVGRAYWVLHGHRWIKAKVQRITHRLDVNTLETSPATDLESNAIGHITLSLQQPIATLGFGQSRVLGALILVDTASHATAGALLIE
jgi:sulfate adenylyltransferase subunit 1